MISNGDLDFLNSTEWIQCLYACITVPGHTIYLCCTLFHFLKINSTADSLIQWIDTLMEVYVKAFTKADTLRWMIFRLFFFCLYNYGKWKMLVVENFWHLNNRPITSVCNFAFIFFKAESWFGRTKNHPSKYIPKSNTDRCALFYRCNLGAVNWIVNVQCSMFILMLNKLI